MPGGTRTIFRGADCPFIDILWPAASKTGKVDVAKRYYRALIVLTVNSNSPRPELVEAKRYLADHWR
jgi:hypothetical protein